ncbi:13708_t:CDS:2, partial [Racocetra persica]
RFQAKNNQRGVIGGAAQKVPILADLSNFRGPCYDYRLYFEKRPLDANQEFYLQTNPKSAQLMQDKDIEEQVIMNITGHRNLNEQLLRNSQITNLESQNLPIYTSPDNIQEK